MKKNAFLFLLLLGIFFFSAFFSLKLGSVSYSFYDFYRAFREPLQHKDLIFILMNIRLPRLIAALVAGAALSISGLLMQTTFQNALAGPYVLGISSGAGLGVAIIMLGAEILGLKLFSQSHSMFAILFGALLGAAFVMFIILLLARRIKSLPTLLIVGILFSGVTASLINILQYFAEASNVKTYAIWSMGNLGGITLTQSIWFALLAAVLILFVYGGFRNFDAFLLGENEALNLGVSVKRTRLFLLLLASSLAAFVTAFVGPIAFVGIAVPHLARTLFNSFSHRIIVPATLLIGANVLVVSDIISRLPGSMFIIPINAITSLIGIPVVIWLLMGNKQINF
jgi:iron complex transport system permease protein